MLGNVMFPWTTTDLKASPVLCFSQIRQRNGIDAGAKLEIFCADADLYMACINDKVVLKLGPRHDIGDLCPKECEGWHFAMAGTDFCIWEKK